MVELKSLVDSVFDMYSIAILNGNSFVSAIGLKNKDATMYYFDNKTKIDGEKLETWTTAFGIDYYAFCGTSVVEIGEEIFDGMYVIGFDRDSNVWFKSAYTNLCYEADRQMSIIEDKNVSSSIFPYVRDMLSDIAQRFKNDPTPEEIKEALESFSPRSLPS